jgi:acyl-CoA synthetase (AMP-forming)/AMP-acid ligase II
MLIYRCWRVLLPARASGFSPAEGTTGFAKCAVLHHRGIVNNARLYTARLGLAPGSAYLSPMPLFHTAGCVMSMLGAIAARATLILWCGRGPGHQPFGNLECPAAAQFLIRRRGSRGVRLPQGWDHFRCHGWRAAR